MDCVNHIGVSATAYCQSCGKALCPGCVRNAVGGQVLCEPCWTAWQTYQQPFTAPVASGPNPSVAAMLGLIPGVGAMYNGQFFKGFIHVVVFAVLISITEYHGIFGLFIGAWVLYQSFEAFHTAKALRDGETPPDPFGLNEVGNWLNLGKHTTYPGQPGATPQAGPQAQQDPLNPGPLNPGPGAPGPAASAAGSYQAPYQNVPYQAPYQGQYQVPYPPPPPTGWGRKEPVGAIVLIGLGLMFLVGQMKYAFPLLLIGLGVWLIVSRFGDSKGGSK
jgi:TM2 domain-containing membrane protein YozV